MESSSIDYFIRFSIKKAGPKVARIFVLENFSAISAFSFPLLRFILYFCVSIR